MIEPIHLQVAIDYCSTKSQLEYKKIINMGTIGPPFISEVIYFATGKQKHIKIIMGTGWVFMALLVSCHF